MRTCSVHRTCVGVGERRVWCVGMFHILLSTGCVARHIFYLLNNPDFVGLNNCVESIGRWMLYVRVVTWNLHRRAWALECSANETMRGCL